MNLLLRTHENLNDPVWSVIISIIILLIGTFYYIYTIMKLAFQEFENGGTNQPERCEPGSGDISSEAQD
tara:strand:+ start:739 stop:945 length:207 start_codon:yes stop_codon:yes gene_type:complete